MNSKLQLIRGTVAEAHTANYQPIAGEPIWLTDNERPKFGRGGTYRPISGVYARTPAKKEDLQYRCLWAIKSYNNQYPAQVPAWSGTDSRDVVFPYATANIPEYALHDASLTKIVTWGDFTCGSFEPRMHFKLLMGNHTLGQTDVEMRRGINWGDTALNVALGVGQTGIDASTRISQLEAGENSLKYEGRFPWVVTFELMTNGRDGDMPNATSGAGSANVFVKATMEWGPGLDLGAEGMNYATPGPIVQGRNMMYQAATAYDRGDRVVVNGEGYEAIAPSTGIEPGSHWQWMLYWYKLKHKATFYFSEYVDFTQKGFSLTLAAGGPHQMSRVTSFPAYAAGSISGFASSLAIEQDNSDGAATLVGAVEESGTLFVARREAFKSGNADATLDFEAPDPIGDPDGSWNRDWLAVGSDRKDEMRIHGSVAHMTGGRRGVGGTILE